MATVQIDKKAGFLMAGSLVVGLVLGAALAVLCSAHDRDFRYGPGMMGDRVFFQERQAPADGSQRGPGWMMQQYENQQATSSSK